MTFHRCPALALLATAALLLAAGCTNPPDAENNAGASNTASAGSTSVETPVLTRANFDLSDHEGQVVLLNFWATWCAPCRAEMPDLVQLQKDLGARGLQVVGVSLDDSGREVVDPFLAERSINYPIVIDAEGEIAERYGGVRALPTTVVIGRGGKVKGRLIGMLQMEHVRPRIEKLLAAGKSASASS